VVRLRDNLYRTIARDYANSTKLQKLMAKSAAPQYILLLARLMGRYCFAGWRLSSSVVVVCNAAGGRAGRLRARGRSGGRHFTAGQSCYVPLGRHSVLLCTQLPPVVHPGTAHCKARSTLATMSKHRSTLSKGRNFNAKLVRRCCRFWQQSRTLLRHCCWCGPGLRQTEDSDKPL